MNPCTYMTVMKTTMRTAILCLGLAFAWDANSMERDQGIDLPEPSVDGDVDSLPAGVYRYRPERHRLEQVADGDLRKELAAAALDQSWVRRAPAVLVIAGVYERSAKKYGDRARRYTRIETGHAAQNVYLQATALRLGTVIVGAFRDADVQEVLGLPDDHAPLALMPVGHPR